MHSAALPSASSTAPSSSSAGSCGRKESRSTSSGTSYSSPRTTPPPSATGTRPGNSSRTEKKRYRGAVSTSPRNGCSAIVWWTAPPRMPSPLVISSTMLGSVGDSGVRRHRLRQPLGPAVRTAKPVKVGGLPFTVSYGQPPAGWYRAYVAVIRRGRNPNSEHAALISSALEVARSATSSPRRADHACRRHHRSLPRPRRRPRPRPRPRAAGTSSSTPATPTPWPPPSRTSSPRTPYPATSPTPPTARRWPTPPAARRRRPAGQQRQHAGRRARMPAARRPRPPTSSRDILRTQRRRAARADPAAAPPAARARGTVLNITSRRGGRGLRGLGRLRLVARPRSTS